MTLQRIASIALYVVVLLLILTGRVNPGSAFDWLDMALMAVTSVLVVLVYYDKA